MLAPALAVLLATSAACSPDALKQMVSQQAHQADGKIGVSARALDGVQRFSYHGSRHFPMQSVYKLPIALAVLHQIEAGRLKLDQTIHVDADDMVPPAEHSPLRDNHPTGGDFTVSDLLERSIVDSDGSASDILLRVIGGTKIVRRYLKQEHVHGIHVVHTEAQLEDDDHAQYDDYAQPDAMVELLAQLQQGKLANPADTALLLGWMRKTETGADRIRAKLPPGAEVADKTGSSGTTNGVAAATNDVAIITLPNRQPMLLAIFLSDARAASKQRSAAIADIASALYSCWAEDSK